MDSIVLSSTIVAVAVIWCISFLVTSMEINAKWRWVERIGQTRVRNDGRALVPLYFDDSLAAMAVPMLSITFGSIVVIPLILFDPDYADASGFTDLILVYSIFLIVGLLAKIMFSFSLRRNLFIASVDGIESVKLRRGEHKVVKKIQWADVNSVHASDDVYRTLTITSNNQRMTLGSRFENLEPLFEIMRRSVPSSAVSKEANAYISKPIWTSTLVGESVKISYSRLAKACAIALMVVGCSIFTAVMLFATGEKTVEIVILLAVLFIGLPAPIAVEFLLSYNTLDDEGIARVIFRIKRVFIPWNEVRSIKFVRGEYWHAFYIYGVKRKIDLLTCTDGLPDFARMVASKVPPDRWATIKLQIMDLAEK